MREGGVGENLSAERELVAVQAVCSFQIDARARQNVCELAELDQPFIHGERTRHLRGYVRRSGTGLLWLALRAQAEHIDLVLQHRVGEVNAREREGALKFHSLRDAFFAGP